MYLDQQRNPRPPPFMLWKIALPFIEIRKPIFVALEATICCYWGDVLTVLLSPRSGKDCPGQTIEGG